ncbi:MAG: diacylglycerol kinase [Desulfovibrionaceae bacterium]|nr:diacylglycerol kinase [Desulfovibrionaceae bacterium]
MDDHPHFQQNPHKGRPGLAHIWSAARYSRDGFCAAFKDEAAFRLILFEALILIPGALFFSQSHTTLILLILPIFICLVVELLNSAIENTLDRISLEIHPLTKKAKDMGSAAQFTAQFFLWFVWISYLILGH